MSQGASISNDAKPNASAVAEAVRAAKAAEAVVFVIGGDWSTEHEGMDRSGIELPGSQEAMIAAVADAVGDDVPLVAVMVHGGSMDISGAPPGRMKT